MTYWLFVKTSVTVMKSTICDEFKCHSNKLFFFNILVFVFSETVLNSTTLTLHKSLYGVYVYLYPISTETQKYISRTKQYTCISNFSV